MKAIVIHEAGGPEQLKIENREIPAVKSDEVLIKVKAFGLNRSEQFTRKGWSPMVKFPRILGIEAVGIIEKSASAKFGKGDFVLTAMGGMGREFDGGYAEYVVVPSNQVQKIDQNLAEKIGWEIIGALPEMTQTAWGSLHTALSVKHDEHLLVRGGTTSVGLMAIQLAKLAELHVTATTRKPENRQLLLDNGADDVLLDNGELKSSIKFDKILEMVGVTTVEDSLKHLKTCGICCMTGSVSDKWTIPDFDPMRAIPKVAFLTTYGGSAEDFMKTPFDEILQAIIDNKLKIPLGKVFQFDEIVEAHQTMDENRAGGKIVVLT